MAAQQVRPARVVSTAAVTLARPIRVQVVIVVIPTAVRPDQMAMRNGPAARAIAGLPTRILIATIKALISVKLVHTAWPILLTMFAFRLNNVIEMALPVIEKFA